MDGWRDILHFDFHGEHVLFSSLRLSSGLEFLLASLLTVFLCALEKYLSYMLSSRWSPIPSHDSRLGHAAFRAGVYWILTLIRLLYMLLAMTFHVGLILVVVTTLTAGQFAIEYFDTSHPQLERRLEGTSLFARNDLASSAEYLDNPTSGATDRLLSSSSYPPRRKRDARIQDTMRAPDGKGSGAAIFAIDDEEEV